MAAPATYHLTPLSSSRAFQFSSSFSRSDLNLSSLASFPLHSQLRKSLTISPGNTFPSLKVLCLRETKASSVTQDTWEKSVLKSEAPVLVEFYASWCGPCRMVHRVIDEIAADYAGRLKCFVLNTDDDPQITEDYEIKGVPVVFLFKDGEKRESVIGTMPKEFYVAAIERVLKL